MKNMPWKKIKTLMAEDKAPDARDRDAFWTEFRQRAPGLARDLDPAPRRAALPLFAIAVVGLALVFGVITSYMYNTGPSDNGTDIVAVPDPEPNQVKRFRVFTDHSAVFILNDDAGEGTILWIADMSLETGGNGDQ